MTDPSTYKELFADPARDPSNINGDPTVKANDVTERTKQAAAANFNATGIKPSELSARSLRAGGAMALLCGNVDFDLIQMLGRWHSDAMIRYLHLQAQPVSQQLAAKMFNHGTYNFLPTETVPIADQ